MRQDAKSRYVLHLLHANTILRGSAVKLSPEGYVWDSRPVEVHQRIFCRCEILKSR